MGIKRGVPAVKVEQATHLTPSPFICVFALYLCARTDARWQPSEPLNLSPNSCNHRPALRIKSSPCLNSTSGMFIPSAFNLKRGFGANAGENTHTHTRTGADTEVKYDQKAAEIKAY